MKNSKTILTLLFAVIFSNLMAQMQKQDFMAGSDEFYYLRPIQCVGINTSNSIASPALLPMVINQTGKSLFLNIHAGSSSLYNNDLYNSEWVINSSFGYQAEFGFSRRINKILTYGFGLGFSTYPSEISTASLTETRTGTDLVGVLPNDPVERRINYLNVSEKTTLTYIDVPVFIEFGNVNYDKAGYFLQFGVKLSYPVFKQFKGSGSYDIKGYYSKYEVEITGVPELGFVREEPLFSGDQELNLAKYNLSGTVSGGISFPVSNVLIIRLSADYIQGFIDISDNEINTEGDLVKNVSHVLSNDKSPTYTRSFGGAIGIIYQLTVK